MISCSDPQLFIYFVVNRVDEGASSHHFLKNNSRRHHWGSFKLPLCVINKVDRGISCSPFSCIFSQHTIIIKGIWNSHCFSPLLHTRLLRSSKLRLLCRKRSLTREFCVPFFCVANKINMGAWISPFFSLVFKGCQWGQKVINKGAHSSRFISLLCWQLFNYHQW